MQLRDLNIGQKIAFGKYSCRVYEGNVHDIVWVKATKFGDFISEKVVDRLIFSKSEIMSEGLIFSHRIGGARYGYDGRYEYSSMHSFLNSSSYDWAKENELGGLSGRSGFLNGFDSHEIESILEQTINIDGESIKCNVRLLFHDEVTLKQSRFSYFNRYGVRARRTLDMCKKSPFDSTRSENSFEQYFVLRRDSSSILQIGANASVKHISPLSPCGVRPTVRLNLDTKITKIGDLYALDDGNEDFPPNESEILKFVLGV